MVGEVGGVGGVVVVFVRPDSQRLLFVDVCLSHGHCYGEDGDVHHDEVADLDGGMQFSNVDNSKSSGAGRSGLEETSEEAETTR